MKRLLIVLLLVASPAWAKCPCWPIKATPRPTDHPSARGRVYVEPRLAPCRPETLTIAYQPPQVAKANPAPYLFAGFVGAAVLVICNQHHHDRTSIVYVPTPPEANPCHPRK